MLPCSEVRGGGAGVIEAVYVIRVAVVFHSLPISCFLYLLKKYLFVWVLVVARGLCVVAL